VRGEKGIAQCPDVETILDVLADIDPASLTYALIVLDETNPRDPTINAVQGQLAQLGYYKGPIDGIYGRLTRDAVAKYQIARRLDVSGSLSAQTLHSLGLAEPTPS